jgi:ribonuclease Z
MRLVMLGTGHALVTRCYNACFVLEDDASQNASCFLVDAGGGNTVMTQLEQAHIDWRRIHDLFITHTHIDHLLGAVWMLRWVCHHMNEGDYEGNFDVWGNDDVTCALERLLRLLLRPQETRFLGNRVQLHTVKDGQDCLILGRKVSFFDIHSSGAKQFGFVMEMDKVPNTTTKRLLACCGDEPFKEENRAYVQGATWLIHEAFCLHSDIEKYDPHPINHGSVAEACDIATSLGVKNLVLYHTEDDDLPHRKERYLKEGRAYFSGNLYIPDDLEVIDLH